MVMILIHTIAGCLAGRPMALAWRVVMLAALLGLPLLAPPSARAQEAADGPEIELENLDRIETISGSERINGGLFSNRLVFSRIQNDPQGPPRYPTPIDFGVHDEATVRIKNAGSSTLTVSALTLSNTIDWRIESGAPGSLAPGETLDVRLRFVTGYSSARGCTLKCVRDGTLTIASNDADEGSKVVQLAGFWQDVSEGGDLLEPTVQEMVRVFGYATTIVNPGQTLFNRGQLGRVGEEVLAPYFERVDPTQPVRVRQLAAYHGNDKNQTETIRWFSQGNTGTTPSIFTHAGSYGQTILPPRSGSTTTPAAGGFNPTGPFGFLIGNEWSDHTLNSWTKDIEKGCDPTPPKACGHHVRVWPVRNREGGLLSNTYLIAQDYANNNNSVNYDFQDNIYLVSNVKPAGSTAGPDSRTALFRLDTGTPSGTTFTDSRGYTWSSDQGFFSPSNVINENPGASDEINGTADDTIYRSYRGKTGANPLSYALPVGSNRSLALRLHFAERFWTSPGKRVFDVSVEGNLLLEDFDLFVAAGAKNSAYVIDYPCIVVQDGTLNLAFEADLDNSAIAGIEVLTSSACATGPDTTPPAAPSGLTATGTASGINLNWNDNAEADLAGYNVYRATSAGGPFTKLNAALIAKPTSQYSDTSASEGTTFFYQVRAVDGAGNESAASNTASAARPDATPPATPANLMALASSSKIALDWDDNGEDDLRGYNVYRGSSPSGSFTKLTATPISASAFDDTTAPRGVISYYRVEAVDLTGNTSAPATTDATRPVMGAPTAPTGGTRVARLVGGQVLLDWSDSTEADLQGYNVYRATSISGPFVKLNAAPLAQSSYTDTAIPASPGLFYRIVAVDDSNNESGPLPAALERTWIGLTLR